MIILLFGDITNVYNGVTKVIGDKYTLSPIITMSPLVVTKNKEGVSDLPRKSEENIKQWRESLVFKISQSQQVRKP